MMLTGTSSSSSGFLPSGKDGASLTERQAGYTVVELMMALTVFMVGIVGVVHMQEVTVGTNQHAQGIAVANQIAESWLDELVAESGQWNGTDTFNGASWIDDVGPEGAPGAGNPGAGGAGAGGAPSTGDGGWTEPTWNSDRNWGRAFDAIGNPIDESVGGPTPLASARFCSHIRLTWLYAQQGIKAGNGLIRAEVRVFWPKSGVTGLASNEIPENACDIALASFDTALGQRLLNVVYLSTTIRQNATAP